jgi:hypothetical protein
VAGGNSLALSLSGPCDNTLELVLSPFAGATPQGDGLLRLVALQALGGHRVVVAVGSGSCDYADQNNAAHFARVVGVTVGAASLGALAPILQSGRLAHAGWSWAPDQDVFLGTSGQLTQTPPVFGFFSQALGFALSPTEMWVSLSEPINF